MPADVKSPARHFTFFRVVVAIVVLGYGFFLARHVSPHAAGSDSSGYFNSARLLAHGQLFAHPRPLPGNIDAGQQGLELYQPLGFIRALPAHMVPTYPTGVPLHLLIASRLVGWDHAAYLVNLGAAFAGGLLLFALGRRLGLDRWLALGGAVWLALCPLFLFAAVQPLSDLLAVTWSLATLYAAWRAREHGRWAVLTGLFLGIAILVRPTNLLLVLPILVAVGWRLRAYLLIGLGGAPCALFLAYYNWRLYGSPTTTGYGAIWDSFKLAYVPHNLEHFAHWVPTLLTAVVFLGLGVFWLKSDRPRLLAMLGVWALALMACYAAYYHSGETWWYLRFILPAFPVLILAALLCLAALWQRHHRPPWVNATGLALCLGLVFLGEIRQMRQLDVLSIERGERSYSQAAQWARTHLPADSVIACMQVSGAFFYYTDYVLLRWDQIKPETHAPLLAALDQQHYPLYAALFDFETSDALPRLGGQWTKLATVGQVTFWQKAR